MAVLSADIPNFCLLALRGVGWLKQAHNFLEFAGSADNEIAQDQDRPPLADEVERPGDRAALLLIRPGHEIKDNGLTSSSQVTIINI